MNVQPFYLLSTASIAHVCATSTDVVNDWRRAWGLEHVDMRASCVRAWDEHLLSQDVIWRRSFRVGEKAAWFAWHPDIEKYLQRQMFPSDQRFVVQSEAVTIASESAMAALNAFFEQIAKLFLVDS